mmetsp:Transcript_40497/g.82756  ORF Transcript_40497/g.82756 Transcript_40497/m.82756 type:complete len:638 (-) Transcript_40497:253-2166(-)|eukprot:CAMPEP_0181288026 /NCGR_PEP_ID=MMETSP1101-20121128/108_1 /TAXON_ID=46948 /ORGANISM="Rhodomonas abbreviata, Strain Caron Lab Isolate" /LENGTH=637 /DNA_ID=CAMNT_0023392111 /DNA_START=74 /DNA_END=1987 /DNA_ORIENTATION=-
MAASMGVTGDTTVWFTQDGLDADNYSSLFGVCDFVRDIAHLQSGTVHFMIDVSIAYHDFRLPRFQGPVVEKAMLSSKGFNPMPEEHRMDFDENGAPEPGIKEDTDLLQESVMLVFNQVVAKHAGLLRLLCEGRVRLYYLKGNQTEQGLWTPMVPNTFLFYSAKEDRMRTFEEVNDMTKRFETEAWAAASPDEPFWQGYLPAPVEPGADGKKGMATEKRLGPSAASKLPTVSKAFGELRKRFHDHLKGENAELRRRSSATTVQPPQIEAKFFDRDEALKQLQNGKGDVYMIICAPAGFALEAYKKIQASPGSSQRVRVVTGDCLTLDGADNLVGQQWNEFLDIKSMTSLLLMLQKDQIPCVFTPTQLFKEKLANMGDDTFQLKTGMLSASKVGEAAEIHMKDRPPTGSGFTMLGYQFLWNAAKRGRQAVYDVLSVFLIKLILQMEVERGRNLQEALAPRFKLLPIKLDNNLGIERFAEEPNIKQSVFIPDIFGDKVEEWWKAHAQIATGAKLEVKPPIMSPFSTEDEASRYLSTLLGWYEEERGSQTPLAAVGASVSPPGRAVAEPSVAPFQSQQGVSQGQPQQSPFQSQQGVSQGQPQQSASRGRIAELQEPREQVRRVQADTTTVSVDNRSCCHMF